jgi:hypothetical protein
MNTENRVLAMLNKIGNVRTAKKENLGVIEDAINDVKSKLEEKQYELKLVVESFKSEVNDAMDKIMAEGDYLISATSATESGFEELVSEYNNMADELTSAGVDFDNSEIQSIVEEFNAYTETARNIINVSMQNF